MAGYSDIYRTIPGWVQGELDRRASRNYVQQTRSAWVRVTSGFKNSEGERKILMGGDISKNNALQFGFSELYDAPDAIPPKRPVPGVTSIDITESKRTAEGTIKWKAWSLDQLEELQPFFMNPATTMFIEIGWSDMDPSVVVDPLDTDTIAQFYKGLAEGPEGSDETNNRNYKDHPRFSRMMDGSGMYFIFPAKISDFSFEMNNQGGFDCSTSVIALAEAMYKLSVAANNYPRLHAPDKKNSKTILERIRDDLEFENPDASEARSTGSPRSGQRGLRPGPSESGGGGGQEEITGGSPDTPKVHGGENYPSSRRLGPNHYYSWGQIEKIFNEAFQLAKDGDINSVSSTWRIHSGDTEVAYFRDEIGLKSRDLDVCVVNAGEGTGQLPPKFDKSENANGSKLEMTDGRAGWLYHLYISTSLFKQALKSNNKYYEALKHMLEECSKACYGIWDFELTVEREHNSMQVIDRNHLFAKTAKKVRENDSNFYTFQVFSENSQVRDFTLSSDLTDKFVSIFAAKNLNVPDENKPIVNSRSDVEGQFFQRFQGSDEIWEGLRKIQEAKSEEQTSVFDEEKREQNEKRQGLSNAYYAPLNVPKETELSHLKDKRSEEKADWGDASFDSIFPDAWEILEIERDINADQNEGSAINANALINVDVSVTLNGIAGLRRYQVFKVAHVPEFYRVHGFFVITSVRHSVQNNDWVTEVKGKFYVGNMLKLNIENSES